jgi:MFS family permease
MAIAIAWIEVTPNDWSAVIMRDVFHATRAAGAATVVFAAAMLLGRLVGDHVVERFGSRAVFDGALLLSLTGAIVLVVAPWLLLGLMGFAIWGLGVSVLFPQLYGMAATLPGTAAGAGLGAMALGQRFGGLMSPLLVGFIAEQRNLRWSVAVVILMAMVLVLLTRRKVSAGVAHTV